MRVPKLGSFLLAVGWLGTASFAAAQAPPPANTLEVSASGAAQANPDIAVVQMAVQGKSPKVKEAYAQAQAQAEQVRGLLRQQGFTPEQAHWSSYSLQPNMDYRTHHITDYTVSVDLDLEVEDFAKIGPLLDASSAAGLDVLRGVQFELKRPEAAKALAIADAYRQASHEAEALARAAGRQLGPLEHASLDSSAAPARFQPVAMASAMLSPSAEFTPNQITVSAHVVAVYRLQP